MPLRDRLALAGLAVLWFGGTIVIFTKLWPHITKQPCNICYLLFLALLWPFGPIAGLALRAMQRKDS